MRKNIQYGPRCSTQKLVFGGGALRHGRNPRSFFVQELTVFIEKKWEVINLDAQERARYYEVNITGTFVSKDKINAIDKVTLFTDTHVIDVRSMSEPVKQDDAIEGTDYAYTFTATDLVPKLIDLPPE